MFVQRNEQGFIKGVYASKQPGYAEEELPNTHPDIVEYNKPRPLPVDPTQVRLLAIEDALVILNTRLTVLEKP